MKVKDGRPASRGQFRNWREKSMREHGHSAVGDTIGPRDGEYMPDTVNTMDDSHHQYLQRDVRELLVIQGRTATFEDLENAWTSMKQGGHGLWTTNKLGNLRTSEERERSAERARGSEKRRRSRSASAVSVGSSEAAEAWLNELTLEAPPEVQAA